MELESFLVSPAAQGDGVRLKLKVADAGYGGWWYAFEIERGIALQLSVHLDHALITGEALKGGE